MKREKKRGLYPGDGHEESSRSLHKEVFPFEGERTLFSAHQGARREIRKSLALHCERRFRLWKYVWQLEFKEAPLDNSCSGIFLEVCSCHDLQCLKINYVQSICSNHKSEISFAQPYHLILRSVGILAPCQIYGTSKFGRYGYLRETSFMASAKWFIGVLVPLHIAQVDEAEDEHARVAKTSYYGIVVSNLFNGYADPDILAESSLYLQQIYFCKDRESVVVLFRCEPCLSVNALKDMNQNLSRCVIRATLINLLLGMIKPKAEDSVSRPAILNSQSLLGCHPKIAYGRSQLLDNIPSLVFRRIREILTHLTANYFAVAKHGFTLVIYQQCEIYRVSNIKAFGKNGETTANATESRTLLDAKVHDVSDPRRERLGVDALTTIVGWLPKGEKRILKTGVSVKSLKSTILDLSNILDNSEKMGKKEESGHAKKVQTNSEEEHIHFSTVTTSKS
ncbi:hypothetical protein VNO77_22780 [Canavalia gladiata]|uniref:Uncharacterized protein n=1 Tax=Canavalia gladiata TaxID=3824 RepID=A0AAN9L385_CANGL